MGCGASAGQAGAGALTPEQEAQKAVALCMALNRCMVPAFHRIKSYNFDIQDLVGFDMQLRSVCVYGKGKHAVCSAALFRAFGCTVTTAAAPNEIAWGADIVHVCVGMGLLGEQLAQMQPHAMLLASRSDGVDLSAAHAALLAGALGYLGVGAIDDVGADDVQRLRALPNVLLFGIPPDSALVAGGGALEAASEPVVAGSDDEGATKVAFFSSRSYFTERFTAAATKADAPVHFTYHTAQLSLETAYMAEGCKAVCLFVNDDASGEMLGTLAELGVELILMRCAGFDKVDLAAAAALGIKVARVPAYSPEAVAQHAVALLLTLKWNLVDVRASDDARPLGIQLAETTVGVLGTGRIGYLFATIMKGFGCNVLAYDVVKNAAIEAAGVTYVDLEEIYARADVLSLHVPLLPETKGLISAEVLNKCKPGVALLNLSRGALVDSQAIVNALASGQLGAYGTDVYEGEAAYFFDDHSGGEMADKLLADMIGSPNFQLTGHQAFLTQEALEQIVGTTMLNLGEYLTGAELTNAVGLPSV